jgi:hypothetical protein
VSMSVQDTQVLNEIAYGFVEIADDMEPKS